MTMEMVHGAMLWNLLFIDYLNLMAVIILYTHNMLFLLTIIYFLQIPIKTIFVISFNMEIKLI